MAEECRDCEKELVERIDRMGYLFLVCPECEKWKRLGWDRMKEP